MSDNGALFGEALDVLGFLFHERTRDEQREVGVHMAGCLEHVVQRSLHEFPKRVAVRLDDHAATNGRMVGQVSFENEFVVPLAIVGFSGGNP